MSFGNKGVTRHDRKMLRGVSMAALMISIATPSLSTTLQPGYSPAADNGGGASPGRSDIITLQGTTDVIGGDYNLLGTSARRFQFDSASIATRNARGEVLSGYPAVDGKISLDLGTQQKTTSVTYPDLIQGTNAATLVYDNATLTEISSTSAKTLTTFDTNAPVYGDLRIADIAASTVTIATGDKQKGIYDPANFAILTADSGSTLYNVSDHSTIIYDSHTAMMDGADQDGLSQGPSTSVQVPVTTYSGIAFGGNDAVTDLASLKRYNTLLIAQLTSGSITPAQYESRMQAAITTTSHQVTVSTPTIPLYTAPPTTSGRIFIKLDASALTTTVNSQIAGVGVADGNSDGITTLISASNGSTVVNNGIIAQGAGGPAIRLFDAGTSLTNEATGVIGVGYETLDRTSGSPVPTGISDYLGEGTGNQAIRASDNATVVNRGIVNVANLDIAGHDENPSFGKANAGIVTMSGATSTNNGVILIGGAASAVANTRGLFDGAAGMVAYEGGTATNASDGTIRVGSSFAENSTDLAAIHDVISTNYAAGMVSLSGGGSITNAGTIRIGSLAQNATGMMVGGDGNVATNTGTIIIDHSALTAPSARNAAIWVRGSSVAGAIEATNAASGTISINGVNSVALLVDNEVAGGSARGVNAGTIIVDGGLSVDKLRNYGLFVANASSSAAQDGAVILTSVGAIGAHARDGGTIDVGAPASLDFQAADQIGYYTLGAGSTINLNAAAVTDVDTQGSTGFRAEGGARITGSSLTLNVSGQNAVGIIGTGASSGTTIDLAASQLSISGSGATGLIIEGGATGQLGAAVALNLNGDGAIAAIVDGQGHSLDGSTAGAPVASTLLTSDANLSSGFAGLTGYIARNQAQLVNRGNIVFNGADATGIQASTGATVTNSGAIIIGAGGTGLRLISTGASDVVTGNNTGVLTVNGGNAAHRTRGLQADGAGAMANLQAGALITLNGDGAIGADAINGGRITLVAGAVPVFSPTANDQIAFHAAGAGASIVGAPGALDASGPRSTLFRFDDGAQGSFGATTNLTASGQGSTAIVAGSAGTLITATGAQFTVSGSGASALTVYGGASATFDNASLITVTGQGVGAIVDGRTSLLDGTFGSPAPAQLNSAATVTGAGTGATGYAVHNGGTLIDTGAITLSGAGATGILVEGANSSVAHGGTISLSGSDSIGVHVSNGGTLTSDGSIAVTSGTGILIEGAGSRLTGSNALIASAGGGTAALKLVNGGTVNTGGSFTAGGTAHGVLIDSGAGALTLGGGIITVTGTGNGIENTANSSAVLLQGTKIVVQGNGSGIRTSVAIDPASTATINVSGTNGTGFTFAQSDGTQTTNDLTLGSGLGIIASGPGAAGVRLNTTGAVALAASISVTDIAGGSAVVGGPAASITNKGSLVSASTAAPVVDLRGGTKSFTNTGTIAAPNAGAVAIRGGDNGQSVTLAGGPVTGSILLGSGNDVFLMTGGTLTGVLDAGAGDDMATFRGLTDTNLSGVSSIAGGGAAGSRDILTFDNTSSTGTRRLTGWNTINLINASALRADGDLTLAGASTVNIDASSTLSAGGGVNATISSATPGSLTVNNAGTIDLTNGSSSANDRLTIRGNYVGQNGTLKLDTVLGSDGSPSDRLIIDGGAVSGATSISLKATGLGALTTGDGIELISAINGGTTTATSSKDAFTLAGTHIDAGAYEYRLYASNQAGTSQSWYLRSFAQGSAGSVVPTYRVEVPLLAALPGLLRGSDLTMLATYHKRMGDEDGKIAQGFTVPGRVWGRIIADGVGLRQGGDASPQTTGHIHGYQVGLDLFRYGTEGGGHHDIGLYGGHLNGDARVTGFASGLDNQYVGKFDVNTTYAGLYWTYTGSKGFYVDTVIQRSWYGGHANVVNGNRIGVDGTGILASIETGYGIVLSPVWTLEPQAQVIVQGVDLHDAAIPNATVSLRSRANITARLGARLKGRFETGAGSIQPYARANVWKGFSGRDRAIFTTTAANTGINTPTSSLWGEGGAGITWSLTSGIAVYGEVDRRFTLDHDKGVSGHSTGGSIGLKARF